MKQAGTVGSLGNILSSETTSITFIYSSVGFCLQTEQARSVINNMVNYGNFIENIILTK